MKELDRTRSFAKVYGDFHGARYYQVGADGVGRHYDAEGRRVLVPGDPEWGAVTEKRKRGRPRNPDALSPTERKRRQRSRAKERRE
jgi:hypothetical protein